MKRYLKTSTLIVAATVAMALSASASAQSTNVKTTGGQSVNVKTNNTGTVITRGGTSTHTTETDHNKAVRELKQELKDRGELQGNVR